MAKSRRKKSDEENINFFDAVENLSAVTGVPLENMYASIQEALVNALKKQYNNKDIVVCKLDTENRVFQVFLRKTVVDEIEDPDTDILAQQAYQYKSDAIPGEVIMIPIDTKEVSRITAEKGKHMLRQAIRSAEQDRFKSELESRNQEIITVTVKRVLPNSGDVIVNLGSVEAILYKSEQLPEEELGEGDKIKVFVAGCKNTDKTARATISRTHPGLVMRLFESIVTEIKDGDVEIKAISREAGSRTKIAVASNDEHIDPVGSCIGPKGERVNTIVAELNGEKIDIVKYSENPEEFIAAALAPAEVLSVTIENPEAKACRVRVPNSQLSLAIGNKGQNARLAAKLTGWKIDIKSETNSQEEVILSEAE